MRPNDTEHIDGFTRARGENTVCGKLSADAVLNSQHIPLMDPPSDFIRQISIFATNEQQPFRNLRRTFAHDCVQFTADPPRAAFWFNTF